MAEVLLQWKRRERASDIDFGKGTEHVPLAMAALYSLSVGY